MNNIINVIGREKIDSKGYPTFEAEVHLEGDFVGIAASPSGAPVSKRFTDKDYNHLADKDIQKGIEVINNNIAKAIIGKNAQDQVNIDQVLMDLTTEIGESDAINKAIFAVSLANTKAAANANGIPLFEQIAKIAQHKSLRFGDVIKKVFS